MKEKLLVLAKAAPNPSKKYHELVCVAGITEGGEWRRLYPVPWEVFWESSRNKFSKKQWIEYELKSPDPSDHRKESRKVISRTITPLEEAPYREIKSLLDGRLTTLEELTSKKSTEVSLGVVKPQMNKLVSIPYDGYEDFLEKAKQKSLFGGQALRIDVPDRQFKYEFLCGNSECRGHSMVCLDWEMYELYRGYVKKKQQKRGEWAVKDRFFDWMSKREPYFIVGTHSRFPTYMIVSVVYPRNKDMEELGIGAHT